MYGEGVHVAQRAVHVNGSAATFASNRCDRTTDRCRRPRLLLRGAHLLLEALARVVRRELEAVGRRAGRPRQVALELPLQELIFAHAN